jgi:hypothetical protein
MCTPSRLDPADEDPDDEDDGLNAQDHIFMWLSEAISSLAHNNRYISSLDDSKVKVREPV